MEWTGRAEIRRAEGGGKMREEGPGDDDSKVRIPEEGTGDDDSKERIPEEGTGDDDQ